VTDLLIRDVPLDLKLEIARAAKASGRTQSAEAIERLRRGSRPTRRQARLKLHHGTGSGDTVWSRDEIYGDDGR
jgi:hypothetical protein